MKCCRKLSKLSGWKTFGTLILAAHKVFRHCLIHQRQSSTRTLNSFEVCLNHARELTYLYRESNIMDSDFNDRKSNKLSVVLGVLRRILRAGY